MNGAIFLPTLNRPHLLREFLKSYQETQSTVPIWVVLDRKDPSKEEYLKITLPSGSRFILTDGVTMGDKARELWPQLEELEYVIILNDDHRPKTHKWDTRVISALNGVNVVATNDGWVAPQRLAGAIAFSGGFLRALGWLFPPGMHHLFSDDVWGMLCTKAGCAQVLMDVLVEHDHAYKNPGLRDETFLKINGPDGLVDGQGKGGFWISDRIAFEDWLRKDAEADIQKIVNIQPKMGLMIATPAQDGNCALDYALGLSDLSVFLSQHGVYFEFARVVGSSLLAHARNTLVDMFLKSKCQKLLFVDSDQGWTKETVLHLFQSNKKIVSAVIPHKRFPINLNFEPLEEDHKFFRDLSNKSSEEFWAFTKAKAQANGEIEVLRSGTGMMCIDRSVFEIMKERAEKYFAFDFREDVIHQEFFKMGVNAKQRYVGEDWHFATIAQELNIPMFINANSLCSHKGQHTWNVDRPA